MVTREIGLLALYLFVVVLVVAVLRRWKPSTEVVLVFLGLVLSVAVSIIEDAILGTGWPIQTVVLIHEVFFSFYHSLASVRIAHLQRTWLRAQDVFAASLRRGIVIQHQLDMVFEKRHAAFDIYVDGLCRDLHYPLRHFEERTTARPWQSGEGTSRRPPGLRPRSSGERG